jgi:phosphopantetheinyl transferase (holo-ACP synthase)
MIGNDIVDLNLVKKQSDWKRKGYVEKVFTFAERQFISNSKNPDQTVWELWSRKEAVYKIIIQKGGVSGYYPLKIECLDCGLDYGKVQFETQLFYTRTLFTDDFIYSEAIITHDDFHFITNIPRNEVVAKRNGIPYIVYHNSVFTVSKTHHGEFEKVVFLNNKPHLD